MRLIHLFVQKHKDLQQFFKIILTNKFSYFAKKVCNGVIFSRNLHKYITYILKQRVHYHVTFQSKLRLKFLNKEDF